MNILISLLLSSIAVLTASYILPGVSVDSFTTALVAALVLGVINAFIKPVLLILTLPINIVTLGLFTFVINAAIILFASRIVPGFQVDGFLWAVALSIVLAIINFFLNRATKVV